MRHPIARVGLPIFPSDDAAQPHGAGAAIFEQNVEPDPDSESPYVYSRAPRNVYWEATLACDLACKHCRADAMRAPDPRELSTAEGKNLIDQIAELGSMLVLTGGDPLKRSDAFELIGYARSKRVPVSITPSVTPRLTRDVIFRLKNAGVAAMGVSLDGPDAAAHDGLRGVPGTFEHTLSVLGWAREAALPVQINTTVTSETLGHLDAMYELLARYAPPVRRWSLFLLVPTGRGTELSCPTAVAVEALFGWIYEHSPGAPFHMSTVEAPQYRRYILERRRAAGETMPEILRSGKRLGFGVRDGNGIIFVSHLGDVYPAGFLPLVLGNVRRTPLPFIYRQSGRLQRLRDMDAIAGKCGRCEHRWLCGGSRARAYAMTGDAMAADPLCGYQPT